jgi:hypothetical protein
LRVSTLNRLQKKEKKEQSKKKEKGLKKSHEDSDDIGRSQGGISPGLKRRDTEV